MYRSSALHTKQARAIPTVLWVLLLALIVFPLGGYWWAGKFKQRYFGVADVAAASASAPGATASAPMWAGTTGSLGQQSHTAAMASSAMPVEPAKPKLIGCVAKVDRCECYDQAGAWVETEVQQCRQSAGRGGVLVPYELHSPYIAQVKPLPHPSDRDDVAPVIAAFTDGQVKR